MINNSFKYRDYLCFYYSTQGKGRNDNYATIVKKSVGSKEKADFRVRFFLD